MRKRTKNNYKLLAFGAAAAGAAGYLVGALSSPKKKKATPSPLKKVSDKNLSDVEDQLANAYKELTKLVSSAKTSAKDGSTKKEFTALLSSAKDNKDKAADVLHALKNGTANDKDLKKAIKDARHSIEHIKDFIKK